MWIIAFALYIAKIIVLKKNLTKNYVKLLIVKLLHWCKIFANFCLKIVGREPRVDRDKNWCVSNTIQNNNKSKIKFKQSENWKFNVEILFLLKAKKTKNFDMEANIVSLGKLSKRLKERTYTINSTEKEFVLGRNREAQCVILDVNVSRRHASIKYSSISGWLITDNKVYSWLYL